MVQNVVSVQEHQSSKPTFSLYHEEKALFWTFYPLPCAIDTFPKLMLENGLKADRFQQAGDLS